MRKIDTLIVNANLFTMAGEGVGYIDNGCIAIERGKIIAVGQTKDICQNFEAEEVIDATDKMVIPGFIDAHMHTSQTMLRGMAQDTKNWMMKGIEPLRYYLDSQLCVEASQASVLEALAAGTTTFGEYAVAEHINLMDEFYDKLGVRSNYAVIVYGLKKQKSVDITALYEFSEEYSEHSLEENIRIFEKWKQRGSRTTVNLGAHAPDTLSKAMLIRAKEVAKKNNMKINMHVAQGDREIYQVEKRYGKRSIAFLDEIGYLDKDLIAVHLTEATDEETRLVASRGAAMVVCSGSIGIIDGIVPPAHVFQQAGGNVALGSDQASGNNCNQIINEMKLTALFNKIKYRDPEVMPSWKTLRMATIEGAKALGLDEQIGSIETGKKADIVFIDLNQITMMPIIKKPYRNMVPNLIHSARGNEVCRVIVEGKTLYLDGKYLTIDKESILANFKSKAENFFNTTKWGVEVEETTGYQLQKDEKL